MRRIIISLAALAFAVIVPSSALSHVERNSYWPDPAPDRSVKPAAGGKVPKVRTLTSALRKKPRGHTRVVCRRDSLRRAYRSIRSARINGYRIRPSQPVKKLSLKQAKRLRKLNRAFKKRCKYGNIQSAVFRSRNNDRIVVMPARYSEDKSRRKPTNDPRCDRYEEESEKGAGAPSYRYQASCPNDQNMIMIQGRRVNTGEQVPSPPRENRHGIPAVGKCVRCNIQIEGSGVKAEDVLVDAGRDPRAPLKKLGDSVKDVVIRADRADGIVIKNLTAAHAKEHGIYVHETDGYLLDRVKLFYNLEYGTLTFTSDHGLTRDCEAMGSGDSGLYPGSAVDTGEQSPPGRAPRQNQAITRCDSHHNTLGYSGTMGNGTHAYNNNFYDNATGIVTDSFFAGGHPGYPQDSAIFEKNNIYSNNFNVFKGSSDVIPKVPAPVGTGILIAGGNNNEVRNNRIWDNWRRGTMLMAVPDAASGEVGAGSTSNRNRTHDNVLGKNPGGGDAPNGVDLWWDGYPGNTDNCWYNNGAATSDPPGPLLPSNCKNTSSGAFYPSRGDELGPCAGALLVGGDLRTGSGGSNPKFDERTCEWFQDPPKPGTAPGGPGSGTGPSPLPITTPPIARAAARDFASVVDDMCDLVGSTTLSCRAFDRP